MQFYYLNLDKSGQRKESCEKVFQTLNVSYERISGIDGRAVNLNQLVKANNIDKESEKPVLGCLLSHFKAIETFYNSNNNFGVICEDDICLDYQKYWKFSIEEIIDNAPRDWEIIQLAVILPFVSGTCTFDTDYRFWKMGTSGFCHSTLCYVINRIGAKKILKLKNNNIWDITRFQANASDSLIYQHCITYTFFRPMFTYPDDGDSIIDNNHLDGHKFSKKEIERYLIETEFVGFSTNSRKYSTLNILKFLDFDRTIIDISSKTGEISYHLSKLGFNIHLFKETILAKFNLRNIKYRSKNYIEGKYDIVIVNDIEDIYLLDKQPELIISESEIDLKNFVKVDFDIDSSNNSLNIYIKEMTINKDCEYNLINCYKFDTITEYIINNSNLGYISKTNVDSKRLKQLKKIANKAPNGWDIILIDEIKTNYGYTKIDKFELNKFQNYLINRTIATKIFSDNHFDETQLNVYNYYPELRIPKRLKAYYINLERSIERKEKTEQILKEINMIPIRIEAFDGLKLNSNTKIIYSPKVPKRNNLNKIMACSISHLESIKKFYETDEDNIIMVCEDDLSLDYQKYWDVKIKQVIKEAPNDWEIIQIAFHGFYGEFNEIYKAGYKYTATSAYIINKCGAKKVMELYNGEKWDISRFGTVFEIDHFLYSFVKNYIYHRPLFTYPDVNDSNIDPGATYGHLVHKQIVTNLLESRKFQWIDSYNFDSIINFLIMYRITFDDILLIESKDGKIVNLLKDKKLLNEKTNIDIMGGDRIIHIINNLKTMNVEFECVKYKN